MRGHVAKKGNRYYAVIYEGIDQVTGRQRHRWYAGGTTRKEAGKLLAELPSGERGTYRAGRVTGYFPVPASPDDAFPESVVDLTYRCTIDKQAISNRRWCLAPQARDQLRYAIARFDSFRSVELSESIEAAVGRMITDVTVDNTNQLLVDLTLDDGTVLHLVQPPVEPHPSGRASI